MNELRNRGIDDILSAVVDGLNDFLDVIRAVFAEASPDLHVPLLRHSLDWPAAGFVGTEIGVHEA